MSVLLAALLALPAAASTETLRSSDGAFVIDLQEGWKAAPPARPEEGEEEREVARAFMPHVLPPQVIRVIRMEGPPLSDWDLSARLGSSALLLRSKGVSPSGVSSLLLGGTIHAVFFSYRGPDGMGAQAMMSLKGATYRVEGLGISAGSLLDNLDGLRPPGARPAPASSAASAAPAAEEAPETPAEARPIPADETPRQTVNRMVEEGVAEVRRMLRFTSRLRVFEKRALGAARWLYLLLSPGPHPDAPPGSSGWRLALSLLTVLLLLGPLHLVSNVRGRLSRLPWAEESRTNMTELYRGPGTSHPLKEPLTLKPVGFGLAKEYWVLQGGRLAYRLLWPRTGDALFRISAGLAFLFGLATAPALSGDRLGDLFIPGLAALAAALAARFLFRNAGQWGVILNAQGKALAMIEPSSMTTFFEQIFVVLDAERKPLSYFPRKRFDSFWRKQWWVCPTHEEYGARVVETSVLKALARRLLGHFFFLRSSHVLLEGEKVLGTYTRKGPLEEGRFELFIDRSPILPVIDPRAFLGLLALLSFVDRDPWHPSLRG